MIRTGSHAAMHASECRRVFSAIDSALQTRSVVMGETVLVDSTKVAVAEQSLHAVPAEDGSYQLAFSVVDASVIPVDGMLADGASQRRQTARIDNRVCRLFDDAQVNSALSLRLLDGITTAYTPALTFTLAQEPSARKPTVLDVARTTVRKVAEVVDIHAAVPICETPLAVVAESYPGVTTVDRLGWLATDAVNDWARTQFALHKLRAMGRPPTIHRPLRMWPDFCNLVDITRLVE